jgi:hemoglobin
MDETGLEASEAEEAIRRCVRSFYGKARVDDLLGPVFAATVPDWDHHLARVDDFWSHALLGTERYKGHPYPVHVNLSIGPEHFPRWLALFEETALDTLPAELAKKAIAKARHMARSFEAGIFPFVDKHGRPSRRP